MDPVWIAESVVLWPKDQVQKLIDEMFDSLRREAERDRPKTKNKAFHPEDPFSLSLVCERLNKLAIGGHRLYDCRQPYVVLEGPPPRPAPLTASIQERLGEDQSQLLRTFFAR